MKTTFDIDLKTAGLDELVAHELTIRKILSDIRGHIIDIEEALSRYATYQPDDVVECRPANRRLGNYRAIVKRVSSWVSTDFRTQENPAVRHSYWCTRIRANGASGRELRIDGTEIVGRVSL